MFQSLSRYHFNTKTVHGDQFSLKLRNGNIFFKVLQTQGPDSSKVKHTIIMFNVKHNSNTDFSLNDYTSMFNLRS